MIGCPLTPAVVHSCLVEQGRWLKPHFPVRASFACRRLHNLSNVLLCGLLLGRLGWTRVVVLSRLRSRGFWEVFDERFQFMAVPDALRLDDALRGEDVSAAWMVWSGAAETALADAFCFAGGPVPGRVLVLGRCAARFRVVKLGGPELRKARNNVADPLDRGDVFMYRASSVAPLLDLRRWLKVILRSLEPTVQNWCILRSYLRGVSDFIRRVVVYRGDEAVRGWTNWIREDPLVHSYKWLRSEMVPPDPFLQCQPHLTPGGSGEFRKAWLPFFCRSGQREASLEEFNEEVGDWLAALATRILFHTSYVVLAGVVRVEVLLQQVWIVGDGAYF